MNFNFSNKIGEGLQHSIEDTTIILHSANENKTSVFCFILKTIVVKCFNNIIWEIRGQCWGFFAI